MTVFYLVVSLCNTEKCQYGTLELLVTWEQFLGPFT